MTGEVDPQTRAGLLADVDAVVEERTEVRLTGRPDGGFPAYDFTFRSDRTDRGSLDEIVRVLRHTGGWTDVRVQRRHVRVSTRTTGWEDLPAEVDAPPRRPTAG